MTLDSLSESSLLRLEQYLNSNPYREYSMNKPYFPRPPPPHGSAHTNNRLFAHQHQNPSILAFHELMDNQKNNLTLDRLAYKLRMKSDLNIETLRETHLRRRNNRQQYPHTQSNQTHSNISDSLSSVPPSMKTYGRQPTAITMSTQTMKTFMNEDLNGIEGNAVRVGTLNDLLKQFRRAEFRLVRRPADYLDSASTYFSSNVSTNDRTIVPKPHPQTERPMKQPQALTEYHFNGPTFPTSPSRTTRDPTIHPGLIYQYRTRERHHQTDLPYINQHALNSPEQHRQRLNSLVIQERQPTALSLHDKRIQELREKSLMRTEKQLCICNKLTIVDPFNSNLEQSDSSLPQIQQSQQSSSVKYIFPPIRPFGYLTKKPTDDTQPISWTQQQPSKKKRSTKKRRYKTAKNSLDSLDKIETNDDDDNSQIFNDTVQSLVSLTDLDDDAHNRTITNDFNLPGNMQNSDEHE